MESILHHISPARGRERRDSYAAGPQGRTDKVQRLVVALRPVRVTPIWLRYLITAGFVLVLLGVIFPFPGLYDYAFLLFFPTVIAASFVFNRGSGLVATGLSAICVYFLQNTPDGLPAAFPIALGLFVVIGLGTALTIEALRVSVDELGDSLSHLREKSDRLEEFTSLVSHGLKEPARGVCQLSGFIQEDYAQNLDAAGRQKLAQLSKMTHHIHDLVTNLLYSMATAKPGNQATDLNKAIDTVLEMLEPRMKENNVTVTKAKNFPKLSCDGAHVSGIFHNLILNAMQYNDSAAKEIEIGFLTTHRKHPGKHVFFVKDNGAGIPQEHYENVFKMFKRFHGDTYGHGTGVGLAIVKNIIEKYSGEIWIEPNPAGKGTVFYFYLTCDPLN